MKGPWHRNISEEDSLGVLSAEMEDLENDELSVGEAGFLQGYEDDLYYEYD